MIPEVALNDGTTIPVLGYGTLSVQPDRSTTEANITITAEVVGQALAAGYRHLDTAQSYGTERGIGRALQASGLARDELYLTSKLSNANHRRDDVLRSFERTLANLGVAHLDLFLIHWPLPTMYDGDYVGTWRAVTELLGDGRLRSAGVSNWLPEHLERSIDATGVVPAVNQVEVHPHFANADVCEATLRHGIVVEAWSPLGQGRELGDAALVAIAGAHGRTVAQVILAWHLQRGRITIPKSSHRARMEENLGALEVVLTEEELRTIDGLDQGTAGRIGPDPATFDWIPPAS